MAITDNTIMLIFTLTGIYFVIYKRNKFIGSILLFATTLLTYTNTYIDEGFAFILFITALTNMLWEATKIFFNWANHGKSSSQK